MRKILPSVSVLNHPLKKDDAAAVRSSPNLTTPSSKVKEEPPERDSATMLIEELDDLLDRMKTGFNVAPSDPDADDDSSSSTSTSTMPTSPSGNQAVEYTGAKRCDHCIISRTKCLRSDIAGCSRCLSLSKKCNLSGLPFPSSGSSSPTTMSQQSTTTTQHLPFMLKNPSLRSVALSSSSGSSSPPSVSDSFLRTNRAPRFSSIVLNLSDIIKEQTDIIKQQQSEIPETDVSYIDGLRKDYPNEGDNFIVGTWHLGSDLQNGEAFIKETAAVWGHFDFLCFQEVNKQAMVVIRQHLEGIEFEVVAQRSGSNYFLTARRNLDNAAKQLERSENIFVDSIWNDVRVVNVHLQPPVSPIALEDLGYNLGWDSRPTIMAGDFSFHRENDVFFTRFLELEHDQDDSSTIISDVPCNCDWILFSKHFRLQMTAVREFRKSEEVKSHFLKICVLLPQFYEEDLKYSMQIAQSEAMVASNELKRATQKMRALTEKAAIITQEYRENLTINRRLSL
eukprot:TRINITY_DN1582_c0_g1_i1.p1 TRINITY_DN1582_c0_g1~~TRINITY_DN1582_c0_g1_i1.p1  ORF type:complete len:507 (-),score=114.35 TRINITY_DN1582_c0_g1_i1:45-1565(-)